MPPRLVGEGLRIARAAVDDLQAHAAEGYPHEVVGILAARDGLIQKVRRLDNERTDRARDRYYVGPLVLFRAEQALEAEGFEVVGYYHSHPDHPAAYSETDREQALPNRVYAIVSVDNGNPIDLRAFVLTEDRTAMVEQPISIEDQP